jgi:nucleotide-binding universal stress UspA family protein
MSWQPIVVGVDASPEAAGAAALGWRIAQAAKVRCHLVHACRDFFESATLPPPPQAEEIERAIERTARRQVESALEGSVPLEILDTLTVRQGRASVVLGQVVAEVDAGMVILGGKHHSTLNRWVGGSTALDAVRTLPVPLLVTTGPATARRRILAAVDLSAAARPTIEAAEAIAGLFDGQLEVLFVVEPIPVLPEVPIQFDVAALEADAVARFEQEIWPLVTRPGTRKEVRHGAAPETIQHAVREWQPDLLVVGSHGKRWIDRVLLGSVTEKLLNGLTTSLLVVPAPVAAVTVATPAQVRAAPSRLALA